MSASTMVGTPTVGPPTGNPNSSLAPKFRIGWVDPTNITVWTDDKHPKYGILADPIRNEIKKDAEFESVVNSMKSEGFTSIVQLIQLEDGRLVAVTGRRRRAAAIEAGIQVLARIVPEASISRLAAYVSMIRENEVRKEDDQFNRAEKAARLRDLYTEEYRPKDSEGNPVADWAPNKTQQGLITKAVMLDFGFNPKLHSGKFSELLALNNLIEKVRSAVRKGEFTVTQVLAASLHTLTPAKQDAKIETMLEAKRNKEKVTSEALRGEKAVGSGVSFSRTELLELADSKFTPAQVKSFIWLTTNKLSVNQLGAEVDWVEKARADVAEKKVRAAQEAEAAKAKAAAEKAAKAELKQAAKLEKEAAKAEKAARREKVLLHLKEKGNVDGNGKVVKAEKVPKTPATTPKPVSVAAVDDVLEV